jgi:hypothetical protein
LVCCSAYRSSPCRRKQHDGAAKDGSYQATPLVWAEHFVRESGADKVEYFQREGTRPKQYTEIAEYLRSKVGA